ncbi:hypothetical protein ACWGH5_29165 [Streptomyces sp. NPDC054864]
MTWDGKAHYYLTDALGSVVATADESGNKANSYSYSPRVVTRAASSEKTPQPYQFAGGYQDPTGPELIEQFTTALAETELRLAELIAIRKVIDGLGPPDHALTGVEPATATVYQRIVTAFNEHPRKVFRVRDLHK